MSNNIGVTYNNPGNLTVAPGVSYAGQTGVYHSPNGLNYAIFGSPQAGSAALDTYIANNIGTNPNTSESTIGQLLGFFLNGDNNGISNTSANPNAIGYVNAVSRATGLGLNDQFTSSQISDPGFIDRIAQAISTQEGTSNVFVPGTNAQSQVSANTNANSGNTSNGIFGFISNGLSNFASGIAGPVGAITSSVTSQPSTTGNNGGIFGPIIQWLNGAQAGIGASITGAVTRGGFGIVGIILLAAGIIFLVASNKTVVEVTKAAVAAAAVA